jgi:hypothetical protein
MIEKRPYWQEPGFDTEKSRQIEEGMVAKFSPLTELPVAISRWGYDFHLDCSPIFCTYLFSDQTSEQFLLSHYRDSPPGQSMLNLMIADQDDDECSHYFTLRKVRSNCFVMTHHYTEPEFRYNPDEEVDLEYLAMRQGIETYYPPSQIRDSSSREDAIANSPFKDSYLEAASARNKMVSELMFDRTFTGVFDHLTERLPLYVKSKSYAPSPKTGKTFYHYYLLDNPSDREVKGGSLYFGPKHDIAKEDVIIFQAMLHNGKNLCYRNQPVARIQPNGEIHWQSFEDKQIFSLEVRDFLQELMGDKVEVVNPEINVEAMTNGPLFSSDVDKGIEETHGSIIYDKHSDDGGDLLIIKAEPEVLAINFVNMLRKNFGLTHQGIRPVRSLNLPTHHSDRDFQFELSGDADSSFTNSFFDALNDASK